MRVVNRHRHHSKEFRDYLGPVEVILSEFDDIAGAELEAIDDIRTGRINERLKPQIPD